MMIKMNKIPKIIIGWSLIVVGAAYNLIPYSIFIWTGQLVHRMYRIPVLGWIIGAIGVVILIRKTK